MSKSVTIVTSIRIGDDEVSGEATITNGKRVIVDESFSSEDMTLDVPIDVSALKSITMLSSANLGIAYNESGGPHSFSHSLVAGVLWHWDNASGIPNPFGSSDVANIVATQVGDSARLRIWIVTDPTP